MKTVKTNDGYVSIPDEWIVITNQSPQDSQYVGVVEIRGGDAYNAPHFIFFSSTPIYDLTNEDKNLIINCCTNAYPRLENILAEHIPLQFDENKKITNGASWQRSPLAGCFDIPEFGTRDSYPYGAMIIRSPQRKSRLR